MEPRPRQPSSLPLCTAQADSSPTLRSLQKSQLGPDPPFSLLQTHTRLEQTHYFSQPHVRPVFYSRSSIQQADTSSCHRLYKNFFLPWFFDSSTKQIIQPDTPLWSLVGDAKGNKAGEAMAWNRGFMVHLHISLLLPFQKRLTSSQIIESLLRLAAIHETSAAKDETLVAAYDSYIQANVAIFSESCEETTSTDGHPTYDWTYALGSVSLSTQLLLRLSPRATLTRCRMSRRGTSEEVSGIHSYYDIHGVFKAWQRNPTLFG